MKDSINDENKAELSDLDEKILERLSEDSRKAFTKIAKELDVPDTTIHFRVKKLRDTGIIKKFSILTSIKKLGFDQQRFIRIVVGGHIVQDITIKKSKEISDNLIKKYDYNVKFLGIGEDHSIYLLLISKTIKEMENILTELKKDPDILEINVWNIKKLIKGEELLGV
ncbi:MAG: AsnC family transcriptional regulator [Candidatus Lokiarchaeota archaeon]|nr:AsnC family transcriptional regulator [Candidatus Lokiarchaeota archaeon]